MLVQNGCVKEFQAPPNYPPVTIDIKASKWNVGW